MSIHYNSVQEVMEYIHFRRGQVVTEHMHTEPYLSLPEYNVTVIKSSAHC